MDEVDTLSLQEFLTSINSVDSRDKVIHGLTRFGKLAYKTRFSEAGCPLLNEYVQGSPQCVELFNTLTHHDRKDYRICALVLQLLTYIFLFKTTQKGVQVFVGRKVLRKYMKTIKWLLTAEDQRNCVKTLNFFEALVQHGKASPLAREVAQSFDFKYKPFLKIPVRKYPQKVRLDPRAARYAFTRFAMSFLELQDGDLLTTILQKGFLTGLLRELPKDSIQNVEYVLRSYETLLRHPGVPIQTRIGFFNRWVLEHICKLYTVSDEHAAYAHQFMLAFLKELEQSLSQNNVLWKHHKRALLEFLGAVRANEHLQQQQLVLSVLQSYPRLTRLYLRQLTFSFDPRPSFRWLANVNLLLKIYVLPVSATPKVAKVKQSKAEADLNAEPKKTSLMDSIFPSSLDQVCLNRGLLHPNLLVVYTTVKLLLAIFNRYAALKPPAGEGVNTENQQLLRRHLPGMEMVLRVRPRLHTETMQAMFLSLMWCYQQHLPELILESRFDIWKLLAVPSESLSPLCQYRLIKLLRCSEGALTRIWARHRESLLTEETSLSSDTPSLPSGAGSGAGGEAADAAKKVAPPTNFRRVLDLYLSTTSEVVKGETCALLVQILRSSGVFVVLSLEQVGSPRDLEASVWLDCLTPSAVDFFENLVYVALNFVMVEPGVWDRVCSPFLQFALARAFSPEAISFMCRVCLRLLHSGLPSPAYLKTLITCLTAKRKKPKHKEEKKKEEEDNESVGKKRKQGQNVQDSAVKKTKINNNEVSSKTQHGDEMKDDEEEEEQEYGPPTPEFEDLAEFVKRKMLFPGKFFTDQCAYRSLPVVPAGTNGYHPSKLESLFPSLCQQPDSLALTDLLLSYYQASLFSFRSVLTSLTSSSSSSSSPAILRCLKALPPTLLLSHLSADCFKALAEKGVKQLFLIVSCEQSLRGKGLVLQCLAQHLAVHALPVHSRDKRFSLDAFNRAALCFETLFHNLSTELTSASSEDAQIICDSLGKALKYILPAGFNYETHASSTLALVVLACMNELRLPTLPSSSRTLITNLLEPWIDLSLKAVREQDISRVNSSRDAYPIALVLLSTIIDTVPDVKLRNLMSAVLVGPSPPTMLSLLAKHFPLAQRLFVHSIPAALRTLSTSLASGGDGQIFTDELVSTLLTASAQQPLCDVICCVHPHLLLACFDKPSEASGLIVARCLQSRFAAYFAGQFAEKLETIAPDAVRNLTPALNAFLQCPHADLTIPYLKQPALWKKLLKWGMESPSTVSEACVSSLRALVGLHLLPPCNLVELCLEEGKNGKTLSMTQLELCGFVLLRGFSDHAAVVIRGLPTLRTMLKKGQYGVQTDRLASWLLAIVKDLEKRESDVTLDNLCGGDIPRESLVTALNNFFSVVLNNVAEVGLPSIHLFHHLLAMHLSHPFNGVMPARDAYNLLAGTSKFIEIMIYPSIIGESFHPITSTTPSTPLLLKAELLKLLLLLFSPSTAGVVDLTDDLKNNLLSVLLAGYHGTNIPVDVLTLSLLQLFPSTEGVTFPDGGAKWGRAGYTDLSAQMEDSEVGDEETMWVYDNFDKQVLARGFPCEGHSQSQIREVCYDPSFLLRSLIDLFKRQAIDCNRAILTQLVSYIVLCLSNSSDSIRRLAYTAMAMFCQMLDALNTDDPALRAAMHESFPEMPQVQVLFSVLKNAITEDFMLLPAVATSFVARALVVVMSPGHYLYKSVNHFLLARPALDLTDVPMFYSLFNTGTAEYRKERTWLLWMLLQGLVHPADFEALNRRFVFPTLMSFHDSIISDNLTREIVLNLFKKAAENPFKLLELVEHHGLLTWLSASVAEVRSLHQVRLLLPTLHSLLTVLLDQQAWTTLAADVSLEPRLVRARMECLSVLQVLPSLFQRFSLQEAILPSESDPTSLTECVTDVLHTLSNFVSDWEDRNVSNSRFLVREQSICNGGVSGSCSGVGTSSSGSSSSGACHSSSSSSSSSSHSSSGGGGASKLAKKKKRNYAMPLNDIRCCGVPPCFFTSLFSSFALQYPTPNSSPRALLLFKSLFRIPLSVTLKPSHWMRDVVELVLSSFLFLASSMTLCQVTSPSATPLSSLNQNNNYSDNGIDTPPHTTCQCEVFGEWVGWLWTLLSAHRPLRGELLKHAPTFVALYSLLDIYYRHQLLQFDTSESILRKDCAHTLHKINSLLLLLHLHSRSSTLPSPSTASTSTVAAIATRTTRTSAEARSSAPSPINAVVPTLPVVGLPRFPLNNPFLSTNSFSLSSFPSIISAPSSTSVSAPSMSAPVLQEGREVMIEDFGVLECLLEDFPHPSSSFEPTPTLVKLLQFIAMHVSHSFGRSLGISIPLLISQEANPKSDWKRALKSFRK